MCRIGIGHDTHRLRRGKQLVLGGVEIPDAPAGTVAHSDGDVLLHALVDALLGAAGGGDIGDLFPNTDPRWKNASSDIFLAEALRRVRRKGFRVANADCIVFLERPALGSRKRDIAARVAKLLGVAPDAVGVKAKSGEGIGAIGRAAAVAAQAVVLLARG
ncbi:MAG: 2-C-methyl-D-erythritol 2,4-cyclodiphosphate synthase [Planctomycetota bacterium]